jgi:hypothetical protein
MVYLGLPADAVQPYIAVAARLPTVAGMNVIETAALGKRFRRKWALHDCTLAIPGGHLVALVGPA